MGLFKGDTRVAGTAAGALIVALAVCLGGILFAGSVRAQGIGIVPGVITIDDAVRGNEYTKLVTLLNQTEDELTFEIAKNGEAATWASLHPVTDPSATVDKVVIPAKTSTRFLLQITVPPDAANGVETATIAFQTVVSDSQSPAGQARANVNTGVNVSLTVNIGGTQKLSGTVLDVYAEDVEVGSPVLIKTTFDNTGNVKAQPEIKAIIKDSSGNSLGEATPSDTSVGPGQTLAIESHWDTSGRNLGSYAANVAVALDGKQIYTHDISFQIVAIGALKKGILQRIVLENSPLPGGTADVAAYFENTTHEETKAVFVAEIYRGGKLLDAITTAEQPVPAQKVVPIKTSVNVAENGKYTIRGKVTYGGRETEPKELTFRVGEGGDLPIWAVASAIILPIVAVAACGTVAWILLRKLRRFGRSKA